MTELAENSKMARALAVMNPSQRTFAMAYKEGKTAVEAYCYAYNPKPTGRGEIYDKEQYKIRAHKMLKNPKIQAYLEAFRFQIEKASIMNAVETCEWLSNVIKDESQTMRYRLKSVELLARIRGWFQDPPTVVLNPSGDGKNTAQAVINIIGVSNATDIKRAFTGESNSTTVQAA